MKEWTRRKFIYASASLPIISCSQVDLPVKIDSPIKPIKSKDLINEEIRFAKRIMNKEIPGSVELEKESKGVLIIPKVSEANFWLGGAFGEGGLLIGDAIVSYFNIAQASLGLKIGAQEYSHALFFMSSTSLKQFRSSDGWSLGADVEYVMAENSGWLGQEAIKPAVDVIALIYNRSGVTIGGSVEGIKYSPIYKN
jgi:lipid-binding SYLF domain-containing protein